MQLTKKQKALIRKKAWKKRRNFDFNYPQIKADIDRIVSQIDQIMYHQKNDLPSNKKPLSIHLISKYSF